MSSEKERTAVEYLSSYRTVTLAQIAKELKSVGYEGIVNKGLHLHGIPLCITHSGNTSWGFRKYVENDFTYVQRTPVLKFALQDNGLIAILSLKTAGEEPNILLRTASLYSMNVDVYAHLQDSSVDAYGIKKPDNEEIRLMVERVRVGNFKFEAKTG